MLHFAVHAFQHHSGLTASRRQQHLFLQQQFNRTGKVEHGSVALPAVMRSGSSGPETFNVGSMPSPQQQVMVGQMHRGHMPPLVRLPGALPCASLGCPWCPGSNSSLVMGCVCYPHSCYFLSAPWFFSSAVPNAQFPVCFLLNGWLWQCSV